MIPNQLKDDIKVALSTTVIGLLAVAIATGLWIEDLQDRVQKKQQRIQKMRGHMDSMQHKIRQLKSRNDKLRRRLHKSITWTTRAIVSETTRPREMRVVAEIIRNRVEVRWRGNTTYKEVILDPYQFSAFNPGRSTSDIYRTMNGDNTPFPKTWKQARSVARKVVMAPRDSLITSRNVLHFHHDHVRPRWANRLRRVRVGGPRLLAYQLSDDAISVQ